MNLKNSTKYQCIKGDINRFYSLCISDFRDSILPYLVGWVLSGYLIKDEKKVRSSR